MQERSAATCPECGDSTPNPDCDRCWDDGGRSAATTPRYDVSRVTGFVSVRCTLPDGRTGAADGYSEGKARDEALAIALSQERPAATAHERRS